LKNFRDLPFRLLEKLRLQPSSPTKRHVVDVDQINATIQGALAAAGLDSHSGPLKGVTGVIQQALASAGLTSRSPERTEAGATIDGVARDISTPLDGDRVPAGLPSTVERDPSGEFIAESFTNQAGTRAYKLYVPANYSREMREPMPLVVMLHGCTQSPDDFATGTRMNALADQHGFLVAYPAQASNANGSKCWNWFRAEDQSRDMGEPSIIAGITREIASRYRVDERRVFVAGMSAGAAMAVILGATYPELFAAVGVHSGLPYGAAHDIPSAFGAMKGAISVAHASNGSSIKGAPPNWVPTIVFHGDRDDTVVARNGTAIVEAIVERADSSLERVESAESAAGGRAYSRIVYASAGQPPLVEQWVLHGAGHAWSGGNPHGSFTDAAGPDASAEMIRFFFVQQRAGTA
jgi:poly(hydroxyalkanoate) depolymerase family esterase